MAKKSKKGYVKKLIKEFGKLPVILQIVLGILGIYLGVILVQASLIVGGVLLALIILDLIINT